MYTRRSLYDLLVAHASKVNELGTYLHKLAVESRPFSLAWSDHNYEKRHVKGNVVIDAKLNGTEKQYGP